MAARTVNISNILEGELSALAANLVDVTKNFGPTRALDQVSLQTTLTKFD